MLGYAIGVVATYPGRSASITGVMVGVTLYAIGRGRGESACATPPSRRGGTGDIPTVYDAETADHHEIDDEPDLEAARSSPGTT